MVKLESPFLNELLKEHQEPKVLPGEKEVKDFLESLLHFLFPELSFIRLDSPEKLEEGWGILKDKFRKLLKHTTACDKLDPQSVCSRFFNQMGEIHETCLADAQAMYEVDPAAVDRREVIRAYPGFYAIAVYRIANALHHLSVPYLPRIFTEYAHRVTGIDIHPGATIGRDFSIDHGTGVVIGESAVIGDRVIIFQGVTLGALSAQKSLAQTKRHPTIGDDVIIYANATILGGETIIGSGTIVGGNAWITSSVESNRLVYYQDGRILQKERG